MSPVSVTYVTKVKEISGVTMRGKVDHVSTRDPDDYGHWAIGSDNLEEWLEKFAGMNVTLEIKTTARDESHLLPAESATPGHDREGREENAG